MAYNPHFPANDGQLADFPPEQREQIRAIVEDMVVNALKLQGLEPGNTSGNIPVSNGTKCVNLNADQLDGKDSTEFAMSTHAHSNASGSSPGFMSANDKQRLDTMSEYAEPNQSAFSNVLVGGITIQADNQTDTLEIIAGAGMAVTPDSNNDNDRITFSITDNGVTEAKIAVNAVTDVKIGNRTISDVATAADGAGTLTAKLSQLGYMIKSITGKGNWYTLPAMTLEAISSLFGISGHAHTGVAGQGPKISYGNILNTPSSLPANGGTADYANRLWSVSHQGQYYLEHSWDGSRWNVTSNQGSPVRVGYADLAVSIPTSDVGGNIWIA